LRPGRGIICLSHTSSPLRRVWRPRLERQEEGWSASSEIKANAEAGRAHESQIAVPLQRNDPEDAEEDADITEDHDCEEENVEGGKEAGESTDKISSAAREKQAWKLSTHMYHVWKVGAPKRTKQPTPFGP